MSNRIRVGSKIHKVLLALIRAKGTKTVSQIASDVGLSTEKCKYCIRYIAAVYAESRVAEKFRAFLPLDSRD